MSDYQDILTKSWDELPEPKVLPVGSWLIRGRNAAYIAPRDDKNGKVLFFYTAKEPMDDVSATELEALGDYDPATTDLVFQVFIENDGDWKKKVLPHLQKHAGFKQLGNPQENLKAFKGCETVAFVGQNSFVRNNEQEIGNTVSNFVKPE